MALVAALMLTGAAARAGAQISPGPLARAHRALEGTRNCLACHGTRKDAMDASCLECHREIAELRTQRRGLHGRGAQARCASCHPDHAGAEFNLTAWTPDSLRRFNHARAGWELDGRHREAECRDCHASEFQAGPVARLVPSGGRPTWSGLETDCATCHEDVHRTTVGAACAECHDASDWAPAPRFDHATTDYPLTGRHARLACTECHAAKPTPPEPGRSRLNPVFQPLAAGQCSSCHRDVHDGRLGAACADCHTTAGFAERKPGGFNHGRTRYPLEGRHAQVACESCHGAAGQRLNPTFGRCADCHDDRHRGTATLAGQAVDCAACHDTNGFAAATWSVARHAETRYPLEGRHAEVSCAACHQPQPDGALQRPAFAACTSCHADGHRGQLNEDLGGAKCERCHAVEGWDQSRYPVADHAATGLPLDGRHAAVRCGACHAASRTGLPPLATDTVTLGKALVQFKLGTARCGSCHIDPHETDTTWARLPACDACHDATSFGAATVTAATHAELGYPLLGAHRAVPCVACHATLAGRTTTGPALLGQAPPAALDLRLASQQCASCHESPHGDQFAARDSTGCASCHSEASFRPADRFDHQRDAAFSLDGAHAAVTCERCHPADPQPDGTTRVRYKLATFTCESCHGGRRP